MKKIDRHEMPFVFYTALNKLLPDIGYSFEIYSLFIRFRHDERIILMNEVIEDFKKSIDKFRLKMEHIMYIQCVDGTRKILDKN